MALFSKLRDWRSIIPAARHQGIHNFSLGTLEAYFRLTTIDPSRVAWHEELGVLHIIGHAGRCKTWAFDFAVYDFGERLKILRHYRERGPVYAQSDIGLNRWTKFVELEYNLDEVFDRGSYPNARKRAKRISYPHCWMAQHKYEIKEDLPPRAKVENLHSAWVASKLADSSTYQIMFPRKRYLTCVKIAAQKLDDYICMSCWQGNEIVAVRVIYREGEHAFDLAQFGMYRQLPSNFSEYFASVTMAMLHQQRIRYLNCGASLNRNLAAFKAHWPHRHIISYMYGKTACVYEQSNALWPSSKLG